MMCILDTVDYFISKELHVCLSFGIFDFHVRERESKLKHVEIRPFSAGNERMHL